MGVVAFEKKSDACLVSIRTVLSIPRCAAALMGRQCVFSVLPTLISQAPFISSKGESDSCSIFARDLSFRKLFIFLHILPSSPIYLPWILSQREKIALQHRTNVDFYVAALMTCRNPPSNETPDQPFVQSKSDIPFADFQTRIARKGARAPTPSPR